jgi:hypothetical protein
MNAISLDYLKKSAPDLTIFHGPESATGFTSSAQIALDEQHAIPVDLNQLTRDTALTWVRQLDVDTSQQLCKAFKVKMTVFPSGNITLRKLDSSDDKLKDCYWLEHVINGQRYVACIAFEETQPTLYQAQVVGVVAL